MTACDSCGTDLPASAKFCLECGAPIALSHSQAEYKQVTVLFADVVHSMDIAAAVGAERLREIMSELVHRCSKVIRRYGGTVDKFTGDGIMAVFGAPVALEDHAFRACLAALAIQQDATALAAEVERSDDVHLQLRVGLNSGEVIAGEIGPGALGYTAIGEQVGMAQRMESAAPPGGVMLSESTARLVEDVAVLGDPEEVRIKGAATPVSARRLLAAAQHSRIVPHRSTFVGRDWELAALTAMLDRSMNGHGCVASVVGPPGIGKSRIVAEVSAHAVNSGVQVFSTAPLTWPNPSRACATRRSRLRVWPAATGQRRGKRMKRYANAAACIRRSGASTVGRPSRRWRAAISPRHAAGQMMPCRSRRAITCRLR
ncbi:adenylate/guanylate cyclase domain-containing protein [Mycobacterium sp.]|uniref:adenylate/guanylate cyclase domain-containing protein n=1 Tax=Mycobacterium sp. TaxID=1785 RepID=UPI002F1650CD